MTELINEFDDEQIVKGNIIKINENLTKQKFKEQKFTHIIFNAKDVLNQTPNDDERLIYEISKTLKMFLKNKNKVLVVGLGNRHISADSFGTECIKRVIATRNLFKTKREVSVVSTSVFGLTGIESADIIKSISQLIKPDVIIVFDTLCANSYETLVNNFQISNFGFSPGAGVGNFRKKVNENTLKIPTISIGVPFVVYAKSFVETAINSVMHSSLHSKENESNIAIFNELLKKNFNNLVLTVKDVEKSIKKTSFIVSSAINLALNNFNLDEQKIILN